MNVKNIIAIIAAIILIIIGVVVLSNFDNFDNVQLDVRKDNVSFINITEQFPEVKTFSNDADFRMGLDKCVEYKEQQGNKGNCVEYGITGNAWYYPEVDYQYIGFRDDHKPSNQDKDYEQEVLNIDKRNIDEPLNYKMTYVFR